MLDLSQRRREAEWMDEEGADAEELRRGLVFIRRINRWLGYTRATLGHLKRFARRWRPGERIEILDLATGSADVPRAILRWARRAGFDVRMVGVDRHELTLAEAARGGDDERLKLVRADVFALPFAAGSFDYVISSMFLHHLSDEQAVEVMRVMNRLSRRGIILADLLRHRRAYAWVRLFTAAAGPLLRHDAAVSVAQAFTREEVLRMRQEAGVGYAEYHRHFGHRFVLAGEKGA